ncbi:Uncharacterized protein APZ42_001050, partial [Daphnia magna]
STPLLVVGEKEFCVKYEGGTAAVTILFSPDVEGLLVAWHDCKALGILHEDYPKPVRKTATGISIKSLASTVKPENPCGFIGPIPSHPTLDDVKRIEEAIADGYADVFDQSGVLKCMEGPEMTIELKDDAEPYHVNGARPIPFADRPEVKRLLDEYVGKGIMIPVTEASEWAAPLVVTRKADGSLRLCVDHTKLNRHVRRPTHPTRTPRDAVAEITGDERFF